MKTLNDYKAEWDKIKYLEGDEAMEAVKDDGCNLQYVRLQTPELCMEAVKANGYALQHVHLQTPELCMEAVRTWGNALRHVNLQTPELCMAAILRDADALNFVHADMFDEGDRVASELDDILNINGTEYKKISK